MCGIFSYCGRQTDAAHLTLSGLQALEYRGYDSWGIAGLTDGAFDVQKALGKVSANPALRLPASQLALGHTRWATHGGVTQANAHPHLDCSGRFAVAHNGIFENAQGMRRELRAEHQLASETDTEIFVHRLEEESEQYAGPEAARRAFLEFEGLNAAVACDRDAKSLIALRNGSPLIVGLGQDEYFVSSDLNSVTRHTEHVLILEDGQFAVISTAGVQLFDLHSGRELMVSLTTFSKTSGAAQSLGDYPHFLLKEIHEQPGVLRALERGLAAQVEPLVEAVREARRVYVVGCGTAHHAAILGAHWLAEIAGIEATPLVGSEMAWKEPFIDESALVLYLSYSGETTDILQSLEMARRQGARTAALVCVPHSSLYRRVDLPIALDVGQEVSVVSTKAFSAKLAALGMLAYALAGRLPEGAALLGKAIDGMERALAGDTEPPTRGALIAHLAAHDVGFTIGRGLAYPIALETAHKIKEVSYVHFEGFAGGELKHGTLALVEPGTPCVVFAPRDGTWTNAISAAHELRARGAVIIGVGDEGDEVFDWHIKTSDAGRLSVLPQLVAGQLLAYELAVAKGTDPDRPRNLAKSVTVR